MNLAGRTIEYLTGRFLLCITFQNSTPEKNLERTILLILSQFWLLFNNLSTFYLQFTEGCEIRNEYHLTYPWCLHGFPQSNIHVVLGLASIASELSGLRQPQYML